MSTLRNILHSVVVLIVCALALLVCACDEIDQNNRYKTVDLSASERKVLLLDFTGQSCVNCPLAHDVINGLTQTYPDNVIPVAVHAGIFGLKASLSNPEKNFIGLMQPVGNVYADAYKVTLYPSGIVDGGAPDADYNSWAGSVIKAIAVAPSVKIGLKAEQDGSEIKITTDLTALTDVSGAKLQLWILEDGIVARQKMPDQSWNTEYVHNHVLRSAVNGDWGEEVSLPIGKAQTFNHIGQISTDPKQPWVAENLSVVAFVYTDSGVLQAEIAHLKH